ncbi:hypothetical protein FIM08_00550 [SAR202 cluster bacterium AC-647-N09_OGT_505m]|nr:hypothetical protein [SAR202 cluster bacterium AC-647-N09_OGT_505m]
MATIIFTFNPTAVAQGDGEDPEEVQGLAGDWVQKKQHKPSAVERSTWPQGMQKRVNSAMQSAPTLIISQGRSS